MADSTIGRRLVAGSLVALTILNLTLSSTGSGGGAVARYGRPGLVLLCCLLVWQGKSWPRYVLVFLSLGVLLAGPIAWANGLPPWHIVGMAMWTVSVVSSAAVWLLFKSPDVAAFLVTRGAPRGGTAGA